MTADDITKLEAYLKKTLNEGLIVKARPKAKDSAEVYLGDEFLAVIYKDEEDGDVSFDLNMSILAEDL